MSITLWKPEPDVLIHQALGKLAEECAELSQALARCLIQGYYEEEPATHNLNRVQVREEMADVKAAMRWLSQLVGEAWGESPREARKLAGFLQWQHMLEADMATLPPVTQTAVTVKPLEWNGDNGRAAMGAYRVSYNASGSPWGYDERGSGYYAERDIGFGNLVSGPHETRKEAEQSADDDYSRRVLSALAATEADHA